MSPKASQLIRCDLLALLAEAVIRRMSDRLEVPNLTEADQVDWVVDA